MEIKKERPGARPGQSIEKQALQVERPHYHTTFSGEFQAMLEAANTAAARAIVGQDVGQALDLWNFAQALAREGEK